MKLNLGCGDNRLPGWENHDDDIDISRPLPFGNASVDFILCEHCVEHIPQYEAVRFFKECCRVLKVGGVARIIVPSLEQILDKATPEYCAFSMRYRDCGLGPTVRGAADNIIYAHGHRAIWTASLLKAVMIYCGFGKVLQRLPRESDHAELRDIDGHHKIIGKEFNDIESVVMEGTC